MAGERNVEFRFRARDELTAKLKAIKESLGKVAETQEDVADSLAKSNPKFKELQSVGAELRATMDALAGTVGDVGKALRKQKALGDVTKVLAEQADALGELAAKQAEAAANAQKAGTAYAAQAQKVDELENSLTALNARQKQLSATFEFVKEYQKLETALDGYIARQGEARSVVAQLEAEVKRLTAAQKANAAEQDRISAAQKQGTTANAAIEDALALVAQYRKQREEVEKINSRLDEQGKKLDAARAKAAPQGDGGSALVQSKAVDRLQQSTAKLAEKQREQNIALEIARRNLAAAGVEVADLDTTEAGLRDALERNNALLAQQKTRLADLAKEGGAVEKNIGSAQRQIAGLNKELASEGRGKGLEQKIASTSAEIQQLGDRAQKAGVETQDLLKPLDQLEKELQSTRDAAARLPTSIEFAGKALVELKNEAGSATQALKQANADLERAQGGYAKTAARADELQKELAPLAQGLNEAGVATDRLADEQNRLQQELAQTAAETKKVIASERAMVNEQVRVERAQKNGIELKRTALSLSQRLRGQILGLTSAYVGLYGVVNQVTQAFRAGSQARGIEVALGAVNKDDLAGTAEELEYIRNLADAVAQDYRVLAKSYAQFRASVSDKLPLEQQRFLFESISKAATVMNLSAEDSEGVFRALSQSFSKGVVNAEELRGQLGDRLPGAVRMLATGLGISEERLNKLLETGQLSAETMLFLAKQANTEFGPALTKALGGSLQQFVILGNVVQRLREQFFKEAESAGLGQVLKDLAETLRGPDMANAVRTLAQLFVGLLKALPSIIANLDKIAVLIALYLGAQGTLALTRLAGAFLNVRKSATDFFSTVDAGGKTAVSRLKVLAGALGLFGTLYATLATLIETNTPFRQFVVKSVAALDLLWGKVRTGFANAFDFVTVLALKAGVQLPAAFNIGFESVKKVALQLFKLLDEKFVNWIRDVARIAEHLGFKDLAKAARASFGEYNTEIQKAIDARSAEIARLEKQRDQDLAGYEAYLKEQYRLNEKYTKDAEARVSAVNDAILEENAKRKPNGLDFAADPNITPNLPDPKDSGAAKKAADEFMRFYEGLRDKVFDVSDDMAADSADTLEKRLDLVKREFEDLLADIQKLEDMGGDYAKVAAAFRTIVNGRKDQRTQQERQKFLEEQISSDENFYSKIQAQLENETSAIAAQVQTGAISDLQGEDRIIALTNEYLPNLRTALQSVIDKERELISLGSLTPEEVVAAETRIANLERERNGLQLVKKEILSAADANSRLADGGVEVVNALADGLADAATGAGDLGDAFDNAGKAFLNFASNFIREIANMILRQAILTALSGAIGGSTTGVGGIISKAVNSLAGVNHEGGVIGNGTADRTRAISPAWFLNAQRFHSGGLPGLKADEVPSILQRGEEVLSKSDPRNILNGGGAPASSAPQRAQDIKIINAIDAGSVMSAGLDTPEGTKAIINFFRANKSTLKTVLN